MTRCSPGHMRKAGARRVWTPPATICRLVAKAGQRTSRARGPLETPLPSAQESRRSRRGMTRAAAPGHRAQERAGRRQQPGHRGNRGDRGTHPPRIESGRIRKSRAVTGRHRHSQPAGPGTRRVRGQARLERRAANGGRRRRRHGGGRLHPAVRRATARAAPVGVRCRGERPGREQWTTAASRQRQPRQAQGQRDAHQPEPVLPQSG